VAGQATGARVRVYADGALVADGIASWSQQVYPLIAGVFLKFGQHVTATQDDGSGESAHTPDPFLRVQARNASPGPLSYKAPVVGCGQAVWITGGCPGAVITAKEGATTLGSGDAPHGEARLFLSPPVSRGGVLLADQQDCGVTSGTTAFPPADSPPDVLPAPTVGGPLLDCQRSIPISGALVGALVTVERSSGVTHTAYFDYPALTFRDITPPLRKGEVVTARQELPVCQLKGPSSKPVTVGDHKPVPSPRVIGPICGGAHAVKLANLIPGCRVRLLADGIEIGQAEAPEAVFTFAVPGLVSGSVITAQQQLCADWSAASNSVTVGGSGTLVIPEIVPPIYGCGGAVRVKTSPGSWVVLNSDTLGDIARVFSDAAEIDVPVSPLLIAGDVLQPGNAGCGGNTSGSRVKVQPSPEVLGAPGIGKVTQLMTAVPVTGAFPGAAVDVYVNGSWRGTKVLAVGSGDVGISSPLAVGDQVAARQRLCTNVSPLTSPPVVVKAPPVAAFSASPTSGEAPLSVSFTDKSTGAITSRAWDFENNGSTDSTAANPTNIYRNPGSYTAKLTVDGPGGTSSTTATINVMTMTVGFDQVAIYNCNTDGGDIHIWTRDATAGGGWTDAGTLATQYDAGFCPIGSPKTVSLTDKHIHEIACVDTGLFGCPGDDPTQVSCRRFYVAIAGKKGGGTYTITVT
jgi:hypothetical protein